MKHILCTFLLGGGVITCASQDSDSLLHLLSAHVRDSNYIDLLNRLCLSLQNSGNYETSIKYANEAIRISDSLGFERGVAVSHNNLGISYNDMGEYEKALKHHLAALSIREKQNDQQGMANSYINTGNVYMHLLKYTEALDYYQRSLKLYDKLGNKKGAAVVLGNIGLVYNDRGDYKEAEKYYLRSIESKTLVGDTAGVSDSYTNISVMYMDENMYDKALEYSLKALNICPERKHSLSLTTCYSNLGDIYLHLKDYTKCIAYEEKAIEMGKLIGGNFVLEESYRLLYNAYKETHDAAKALDYFDKYIGLKDSALNEGNLKSINEMHARFETGKKEKEIELLQKDQSINDLELQKQSSASYRQKLWVYGAGSGILLIFIAGIYLLIAYSNKAKVNRLLRYANVDINDQKKIIEEKNSTITLGLNIAKSIQERILPSYEQMERSCGDHFVLFLPKDIVSGDFYWCSHQPSPDSYQDINHQPLFISAIDCTGHGVPGALMSLHAHDLLEKCAQEKTSSSPGKLLDALNTAVKISAGSDTGGEKFGMDMAVISIDRKKMELQYAGARNPVFVIRSNELIEIKADRVSIGSATEHFTDQTTALQKGDMIYLFSDGYADQIGGPNRKKYLSGNFKTLLTSISNEPVHIQKEKLLQMHTEWKGGFTQTDDILVLGIQV